MQYNWYFQYKKKKNKWGVKLKTFTIFDTIILPVFIFQL